MLQCTPLVSYAPNELICRPCRERRLRTSSLSHQVQALVQYRSTTKLTSPSPLRVERAARVGARVQNEACRQTALRLSENSMSHAPESLGETRPLASESRPQQKGQRGQREQRGQRGLRTIIEASTSRLHNSSAMISNTPVYTGARFGTLPPVPIEPDSIYETILCLQLGRSRRDKTCAPVSRSSLCEIISFLRRGISIYKSSPHPWTCKRCGSWWLHHGTIAPSCSRHQAERQLRLREHSDEYRTAGERSTSWRMRPPAVR
mmetsp:Transcript_41237/g.95150  ORF Transcript_41237/g.95150 Transcript_41237/m.95150 type:complete len:262 (-) Transcript_41237:980-1765(-)